MEDQRPARNGTFKEALRFFVYALYWLLPKFNYAVLYGLPDYQSSVLSLERHLTPTPFARIVVLVRGNPSLCPFPLGDKTRVLMKRSMRGLICFLFARYVFFTHRCYLTRFPAKVVSVNVWDGMPLKRINWMLEGDSGIASQYALTTSAFSGKIMQEAMRPFDSVLVTGLPRNDLMFDPAESMRARLGCVGRSNGRKIAAWLPTFRQSVLGEIGLDGTESGSAFAVTGLSADRLNTLSNENNTLGVVKVHTMAPFAGPPELSNLLIVNDEWLARRGPALYEVLGHGPFLVSLLTRVLQGEDTHAAQRSRLRQLFHDHLDGNATQRLLENLVLSAQ